MNTYDLVIVGGGPAGLAAAASAKDHGIDSILIIERDKELGGILNQCIHNGFGLHTFKEELIIQDQILILFVLIVLQEELICQIMILFL